MAAPLMPKATAVWLVENTSLTFEQIAEFCDLHPLEVQAIADGEVATQMQGLDPIANGQTTKEEIERCQRDPEARRHPARLELVAVVRRGSRFVVVLCARGARDGHPECPREPDDTFNDSPRSRGCHTRASRSTASARASRPS